MKTRPGLDALFRLQSVAVVGATNDPTKMGSLIVANLLHSGYAGAVYPVNPKADEVAGLTCYASPACLPESVDVAYILVPAARAVDAARECAERGVRYAVISAAGFAEDGTAEGRARQDALNTLSAEFGIRIVGPNCNGLYNATDGVSLGFNASHGRRVRRGMLGLASHSGALFDVLARRAEAAGIGISKFVSVGNEADLDLLDYFEYLIDDDATKVIGLVIDAVPDGSRFRSLVNRAHSSAKPIIALKFGQSLAGAVASQAHSSRLAGGPRATDALLDMVGVVRVTTVESLVTAAAIVRAPSRPDVIPGVAGITTSGAAGAIFADAAERHGVRLSEFTAQTRETFARHSRLARIVNPVDVGAIGSLRDAGPVFAALFADPHVSDVVFTPHNSRSAEHNQKFADVLLNQASAAQRRFLVIIPGGLDVGTERMYREGGAVVTHETESTVEALSAVHRVARHARLHRQDTGGQIRSALPGRLDDGGPLTEPEGLELLRSAGIETVRWLPVHDADAAAKVGDELGYPLVMKGILPGVAHKSELGLVALGIQNASMATAAWAEFVERMGEMGDGHVIAQAMVHGKVELIVGVTTDPLLGQFIVLGLGGVFAEDLDEVVLVPTDAGQDYVRARVLDSTVGRILESRRWNVKPTQAVLDVVFRLQSLASRAEGRLHALDINPLLVSDGTAVAVDALVTRTADLPADA
jgi:acyl-CoA synthetase (NDP forming)